MKHAELISKTPGIYYKKQKKIKGKKTSDHFHRFRFGKNSPMDICPRNMKSVRAVRGK